MSKHKKLLDKQLLIGRDEWFELPRLKIPAIKAKIDTGARTSSIQAVNVRTKMVRTKQWVFFDVHPLQGNKTLTLPCSAPVYDKRIVMSSSGHQEKRYVIKTLISIAGQTWEAEITLSDREPLRYRMLIGREALKHRVLINPSLSCNQQKLNTKYVNKLYHIRNEHEAK